MISISDWKEDDCDYEIEDYYIIKLSIDELPDSIGYSIKAWGEPTPKTEKERRVGFLIALFLCFILFVFWLIFKFHFAWVVLPAFSLLVLPAYYCFFQDDRDMKCAVKRAFKRAFKDFNRI